MYKLIFILLCVLPGSAAAECILTEYPGHFSVVCKEDKAEAAASRSRTKHQQLKPASPHKSSFESISKTASPLAMTEEELKLMQTHNKLDGARASRKTKKVAHS
jgi:hypothetical protein